MQHYPDVRTTAAADIQLPVEYQGLYDLAYNFWWTWNQRAVHLFERIDSARWHTYHSPVELLINVTPNRWDTLLDDGEFESEYHKVMAKFRDYMDGHETSWFSTKYPDFDRGPIAYFSTEFGWHESLSIYSGGLGILAGDHCKSVSDLGVPFVGVGLMYQQGYFHQTIDADGYQQHHYHTHDFRRLPVLPVTTPSGHPVTVSVPFPGRSVDVRIWKAQVGRAPVLLLDSDVRSNHGADRAITSILYIRGREMRLCQEILLGLGGVLALNALGIRPGAWHMNEGHSALLALQRIEDLMEGGSVNFSDALAETARNTVFTTHTPVPAGNESFAGDLMHRYFSERVARWNIDPERFRALGNPGSPGDPIPGSVEHNSSPDAATADSASGDSQSGDTSPADGSSNGSDGTPPEGLIEFNLTALAIRASRFVNGVSKLHGEVAKGLWNHLTAAKGENSAVDSVTNGVHGPTWLGPEISSVLRSHLGSGFQHNLDSPEFADAVRKVPDAEIWQAHKDQKHRLIHAVRRRVRHQFARHGQSPDALRSVDHLLDEDVLTVGFARRFATYKRAALIFRDMDRLRNILCHADRPVQILFSGKAHPADRPGQDLIRNIFEFSQSPDFEHRILFLEDYDMRTARYLVQGVDMWLNNPRRPLEASGTSGMKAAMNGVLNFSVLDGWWSEGFDPSHGWALGREQDYTDTEAQDHEDAESFYHILEHEIATLFYDRTDGIPLGWIGKMKEAMASLTPQFNTDRMVREYTEKFYIPASETPS